MILKILRNCCVFPNLENPNYSSSFQRSQIPLNHLMHLKNEFLSRSSYFRKQTPSKQPIPTVKQNLITTFKPQTAYFKSQKKNRKQNETKQSNLQKTPTLNCTNPSLLFKTFLPVSYFLFFLVLCQTENKPKNLSKISAKLSSKPERRKSQKSPAPYCIQAFIACNQKGSMAEIFLRHKDGPD